MTRDVCAHHDRWLGHGQYVTVSHRAVLTQRTSHNLTQSHTISLNLSIKDLISWFLNSKLHPTKFPKYSRQHSEPSKVPLAFLQH